MSRSDASPAANLGKWQYPAILVAIFTFLGIRTGDPGPPRAPANAPTAESVTDDEEPGEAPENAVPDIVDQFRPLSPRDTLEVLQPLIEFFGPALAATRDAANAATGTPTKASRDEATLERLAAILQAETRNLPASKDANEAGPQPARPVSLKTLIGIVPDPKSSGIAYQYDSAIFGISSAFSQHGYVLHDHEIDWSTRGGGRSPGDAASKKSNAVGRLPGTILFRKPVGKDGTFFDRRQTSIDTESPFELGLVLLVPEKPLSGIDVGVFLRALTIAEFLNEAVSGDPKVEKDSQPHPIRIFGPTYSGSDVSMLQVLRHWAARNANRMLTGNPGLEADEELDRKRVVMLWHNGDALKFAPATYEIRPPGAATTGVIQYRTFGPRDPDYVDALTEYVRRSLSPPDWNGRIAIISEASTTYGAKGQAGTDVEKKRADGLEVFEYRYPLNIAEMRRRMEKQKKQGDDANLRIRTAERLGLDLGNDPGSDELIAYATPEYSVSVDELRILRVAEDIQHRGIRYVIVRSSDVRDLIFVCEFLRQHCPDVQLLAVNSDITLNHSERIVKLRGLVVASGLPTYIGEKIGADESHSVNAAEVSKGEPVIGHRGQVFPDSTAAANHVAVTEHLNWTVPASITADSIPTPVKISVNSQKGFLTLGFFVPNSGGTGKTENETTANAGELILGSGKTRFPATSGVSLYLTIPIFLLGVCVFLWYRNRFAVISKQIESVSTILGHTRNVRAASAQRPERSDIGESSWPGSASHVTGSTSKPPGSASGAAQAPDYLERLQASSKSFLRFLQFRATVFDHFRLMWNRSMIRILAVPFMALFVIELTRSLDILNRFHVTMPSLPGFFLCLVLAATTDRFARWTGQADDSKAWRDEWRGLRILRYGLTIFVVMFVWFAVSKVSTFETGLTEMLLIFLVMISVITVAVMTYRINTVWNLFSSISTSIQGLPMGDIFERLPRRLTSRPADFNEIWFETNDAEVNPRIRQILKRTRNLMRQKADRIEMELAGTSEKPATNSKRHATAAVTGGKIDSVDDRTPHLEDRESLELAMTDEYEFSRWLMRTILKPVWDDRLSADAYADRDEKSDDGPGHASEPKSPDADLERQAETLVAVMLVHFVNRGMDLVWTFIISTILITMLMLVMINSYPFQPAGSMTMWISLFVFMAIVSCFRVYFGMNRDGLLSRVHRTPDGMSILDSDFLGKGLLYMAPLLTLLSSLSVGVSEVVRIVLLPLIS